MHRLILCRGKHQVANDYQYWQRSQIPTFHFQKSLPRLPVPKLSTTCDRYLTAQRPLLIAEAFNKTEHSVNHFRTTTGATLQQALIAHDKQHPHTSYITDMWFEKYLKDRTPIPINYNPAIALHNDPKTAYNNQSIRASNLIISALRFYKSLKDESLEPEVYHMNAAKTDTSGFRSLCAKVPAPLAWYAAYFLFNAFPLDMSQYHNIFNTARIPEIAQDRIYQHCANHILVQRNGHFYKVDVMDESHNILAAHVILGRIKAIVADRTQPIQFPLGILTTLNRDDWSCLRHRVERLNNAHSLQLIDSSLFSVCLDDQPVGEEKSNLGRVFLHGDGTNRWFDKSVSLIVAKDGIAGVNFEHSWGDGVAVLRFIQDIHKDSINNPQVHPDTKPANETVTKIEFNLDDAMKTAIVDALSKYKKTCNNLAINILQMQGLGKELCKQYSLSPDAIMQLGFQAAYHKMSGHFVGSYESCSTAAYKHGRTETIRPCTIEVKNYCEAVIAKKSPEELRRLLQLCSKKHSQLVKEAAMGQGFDRHLFALKHFAAKMNIKHCSIFEDPAYDAINHTIISTSTLSSPAIWAGSFGPTVSDGFGIGYNILKNELGVLVTTYKDGANGSDFVAALNEAYQEIMDAVNN